MKKSALCLIILAIPLLLSRLAHAAAGTASVPPASGEPVLTFGSELILAGCWSAAELQGAPVEKISRPRPTSAAKPWPPYSAPHHTLPPLSTALRHSIRAVTPEAGQLLLALTFDLCEGPGEIAGYDPDIINFLRAKKIRATFFAGGQWLHSHPERAMQLLADPLFEIGNHSWSHPNFLLLAEPQMQAQILWTQAQYEALRTALAARVRAQGLPLAEMDKIPPVPAVFRFPHGACDHRALQITAALGLPAVQWCLAAADSWKNQTAGKIAGLILKNVRPGAIVILHANGKGIHTARALALCVPELQRQGYQFVTVSELLQAGPAETSPRCRP